MVVLFQNFPIQPPIIKIMADVVHPDIDGHSVYTGKYVKAWNQSGNVVALLK